MTSEARPLEEEVDTSGTPGGTDTPEPPETADATAAEDAAPAEDAAGTEDAATDDERAAAGQEPRRGSGDDGDRPRRGRRLSLPLVPTLLVLLLLLLGGTAYLWFTRPDTSSVRTGDYVEALQAARSGVVDVTSFDYLTLDDDIEQIRRVTTGDLREEAVAELDSRRQQITDAEAVINTEVVGGGVTKADASTATVWLVIQSTQESNQSDQAQVARYRIEVAMEKADGRWLLSGIKGTGTENE
ncbi:hypothetical protein [Blastococcus litoris]|uniref:hypothetical protein n=1 Tax=Blastococcus litoris TaxID=2171622 RepID=UPI000E30A2F5|nr:hypothetical protein [Blastococcus litoris]